jgi:hypothetical protein
VLLTIRRILHRIPFVGTVRADQGRRHGRACICYRAYDSRWPRGRPTHNPAPLRLASGTTLSARPLRRSSSWAESVRATSESPILTASRIPRSSSSSLAGSAFEVAGSRACVPRDGRLRPGGHPTWPNARGVSDVRTSSRRP